MATLIIPVYVFCYYTLEKNTDIIYKMSGYNKIFPKWNRNSVNSVNLNWAQFKHSAFDKQV